MPRHIEKGGTFKLKDSTVMIDTVDKGDAGFAQLRHFQKRDGAGRADESEEKLPQSQKSRRVKRSVLRSQTLRSNLHPPLSISSFKISSTFASQITCPAVVDITPDTVLKVASRKVSVEDSAEVKLERSYYMGFHSKSTKSLDSFSPTPPQPPSLYRRDSGGKTDLMDRFEFADVNLDLNITSSEYNSSITCIEPTSVTSKTQGSKSSRANVMSKPNSPVMNTALLKSRMKSSSSSSYQQPSNISIPSNLSFRKSTAQKSLGTTSSSPTSYYNPFGFSSPSTLSSSVNQPAVLRRPLQSGFKYRRQKKWWIEDSNDPIASNQEKFSLNGASSESFSKQQNSNQSSPADQLRSKWSRGRFVKKVEDVFLAEESKDWYLDLLTEKYHPYERDSVPYWLSYCPEVIDHHILMMYAASEMRGCSPFSLYEPPPIHINQKNLKSSLKSQSNSPDITSSPEFLKPRPTIRRVLDIGCGPSASWCVGVLRSNVRVEVVGLDICPVQLDLSQFESAVSENLRFVRDDFLGGRLPFEDSSFDYVHASFISSGIPETHWTILFEEMTRILKPGCPLEILECNLLIPELSKPVKAQDGQKDSSTTPFSAIRNQTLNSENQRNYPDQEKTSVVQTVQELLDRHFVSPFPLSVIPAQLSMFSTAMQRPLSKKFIKLPGGSASSRLDCRDDSEQSAGCKDNSQQNLEEIRSSLSAEAMGRVVLQSRIDSLYANKELVWEEIWLPYLNNRRTGSQSNQSEAPFTQKSASNQSQGSEMMLESLVLKSEKFIGGVGMGNNDNDGQINNRSKVLNTELQSHRKRFEDVWSSWKDSMDLNPVGISKLLEKKFGWTCELDQKHHEVLDRQFKYYQDELKSCEHQLSLIRQKFYCTLPAKFLPDQDSTQACEIYQKEINDQNYQNEVLSSQKSELKKMMQSIKIELTNVKKRLGLADDLGQDQNQRHLRREQIHTSHSERCGFLGSERIGKSTYEDYGKANIEVFLVCKS